MRVPPLVSVAMLLALFPLEAQKAAARPATGPVTTTLAAMTLANFDDAIVSAETGTCRSTAIGAIPMHASGLRFSTWTMPNRETTVGVDSAGRVMYYSDRVRADSGMESVLVDRVLGVAEVWRSMEGERPLVARVAPDALMRSDKVGVPAQFAARILDACAPARFGQRGEVRFSITPVQASVTLQDGTPLGIGRFVTMLPVGQHTVRVVLVGCEPAELVVEAKPEMPQVYTKTLDCGKR